MTEKSNIQRKIWIFILLTFGISSICYLAMLSTGSARGVGLLWMWSPGIAAILTQVISKGSLIEFGWRLGRRRYLSLAIIIPLSYAVAIYGITWLTGLAAYQAPSRGLLIAMVPGFFLYCFAALGEEIGWRGFLVPHLIRITSFTKTVLISWIIWAWWHFPAILWADYHSNAPRWFDLSSLTIAILGLSALTAWLRLKSGTIWPAVIWHGLHNLLIQAVFLPMTVDNEISEFIVDDFGIGVMITGVALAILFLRKGRKIGAVSAPDRERLALR
jgi:membrane protease YdiL (CAAX protease family)